MTKNKQKHLWYCVVEKPNSIINIIEPFVKKIYLKIKKQTKNMKQLTSFQTPSKIQKIKTTAFLFWISHITVSAFLSHNHEAKENVRYALKKIRYLTNPFDTNLLTDSNVYYRLNRIQIPVDPTKVIIINNIETHIIGPNCSQETHDGGSIEKNRKRKAENFTNFT